MTRGFYGNRGYRHGGYRNVGFGRGFGGFGSPFIGGLAGGLLGSVLFDTFDGRYPAYYGYPYAPYPFYGYPPYGYYRPFY